MNNRKCDIGINSKQLTSILISSIFGLLILFLVIPGANALVFSDVSTSALKNDSTYIRWSIDPRDPNNLTNYATRNGNDMGFSTSLIEYGTTLSYGSLTTKHGFSYFHQHELKSLLPGTLYHYRIRAKLYNGTEVLSPDFTFTTLTNAQMDNLVKAARIGGQLPKTYYVRTNGNDNCNGLYNAGGLSGNCAFNTISKGMSVLDAGDTLRVQSGTYYGTASGLVRSGIITHPIRIVADGNVIMDGQNTVASGFAIDINLYDMWTIEGFTLQNYNEAGIWANPWGGTGNNIIIANNIIKNSGNGVLVARDGSNGISNNVVIKNNYIENSKWNGIIISPSLGNRNVIVGNTFVNIGRYAVVTGGDYNLIEDNKYTTSDGYLSDSGCGHCLVQVGSGNAVTLRNNSFVGGHGDRLRVGTTQAWNVLIIENYFKDVGSPLATYYHNSINFVMNKVINSGSFQGTGMERLRIENNTLYDFRTKNIGWGGESGVDTNKLIDNVYLTNNYITLGAATNPILINGFNNFDMTGNIFDGQGFQISQLFNEIPQTAHNLRIKNNVFYNKNDLQSAIYLGVESVENVEVKNNIFYNVKGYGIDNANSGNKNIIISYNLVWQNGSILSNAPYSKTIVADPLLVDPANGDFHLKSTSPAVKAGENGVDIGAYWSGSTQSISRGNSSGQVTNMTGYPIEGVIVTDGIKTNTTDNNGRYFLAYIDSGSRTIIASKNGYQTTSKVINIVENSTVTSNFQLYSLTQPNISLNPPVGFWDLNETSGLIASDSSGNANNGILNNFDIGNSWIEDGVIGKALLFDGLNDFVLIPYSSSLDVGTGDFALEAWVKIKQADTYDRIISNYKLATESVDLEIRNNNIVFYARDGTRVSATVDSEVNVVDNKWHQVLGVRSGNNFSVYVDGTLKNSTNAAVGDVVSADNAWFIGADSPSSGYINATIDEVKIYNRALSEVEIKEKYNEAMPYTPALSPYDVNQDGKVNLTDLDIIWNSINTKTYCKPCDMNNNSEVELYDWVIVSGNFG